MEQRKFVEKHFSERRKNIPPTY